MIDVVKQSAAKFRAFLEVAKEQQAERRVVRSELFILGRRAQAMVAVDTRELPGWPSVEFHRASLKEIISSRFFAPPSPLDLGGNAVVRELKVREGIPDADALI